MTSRTSVPCLVLISSVPWGDILSEKPGLRGRVGAILVTLIEAAGARRKCGLHHFPGLDSRLLKMENVSWGGERTHVYLLSALDCGRG